jgi:hypothetical protein
MIKAIDEMIKKTDVQIIWLFILENDFIYKEIKRLNPNIKYLFYNFDDPVNINNQIIKHVQYIDYFINPVNHSIEKFKIILQKEIYFVPKYCKIDLNINNSDNVHDYDIVYIYNPNDSSFDQAKIINNIKMMSIDQSFVYKLFGPEYLEHIYPDIYEGDINNSVYSSAKIIIYLTNLFGHNSDEIRLQIMASQNILMTNNILNFYDDVNVIFKRNYNCLLFDDAYIDTLITALTNYDKYKSIGIHAKNTISKLDFSETKYVKQIIDIIDK